MSRREFSTARLAAKAVRTHKQPWLRCTNVIPWLDKIAAQLEKFADLPERQFIDVVRDYVYSARFFPKPKKDPYPSPISTLDEILAGIYAFHAGRRLEPMPLFCQACVLAMGAILDGFGIISRETAIMSAHGRAGEDSFLSHAVLEVWNSELERWQLHDPTLNLAYGLKAETGEYPASAWELFAKPVAAITCIVGEKNYFDSAADSSAMHLHMALNWIASGMFNLVVTNYLSYNPVAIINLDEVDLEKRCLSYGNLNIVEIINTLYCYGGHAPVIQGCRAGQWITLPPEKSFSACAWLGNFNKR